LDETKSKSKHSTVEEVLKIATQANVKKLLLTHISRRYQDIRDVKEKLKAYPNVGIARDFMNIKV
jgi:ribonuclease Z